MINKLFVDNLGKDMTESDVHALFSTVGTVLSVVLPLDHHTGARKSYGFVEMETPEQAQAAAEAMNGHLIGKRALKVSHIHPAEERPTSGLRGTDGFRPQRGGWRTSGQG